MELEELVLRIQVMADQAGIAIDEVKGALGDLDQANQKSSTTAQQSGRQAQQAYRQQAQAAQASSVEIMAAYSAISVAAKKTFDIIIDTVIRGVDANNRYIASLQGVQSVAQGRGIGTEELKGALDSLVDKFFDITAAATSMKNLLSRGYGLEKATATINAFKNSAAFGRQASKSLSQAVVDATEGIKNENSILVDNAGVTKNVAKMWEEYAAKIGVGVQALTQAQKIEAEYAGIMAETKFQMGDLAKLSGTLSGSQAEAAMSGELLARAYGAEMTPAVSLATGAWTGFQNVVRGVVEALPGASSGLTVAALAATVLVGVLPAGAIALEVFKAKLAAASVQATIFGVSVNTALPWLAALALAIGLVTAIYTSVVNAQKAAAESAAAEAAERKKHIQELQDQNTQLGKMRDRYNELSGKKKLSYSETKEMYGIEKTLQTQYGITVDSLKAVAGEYDGVTAAINDKIAANEKELQAQRDVDAANAKSAADMAQVNAAAAQTTLSGLLDQKQQYATKLEALNKELAAAMAYVPTDPVDKDVNDTLIASLRDNVATYQGYLDELAPKIQNEEQILAQANEAWGLFLAARVEQIKGAQNDADSEALAQLFVQKLWGDQAAAGFGPGQAQAFAEKLVASFSDAVDNADISSAKKSMDDFYNRVAAGQELKPAELSNFQAAYEQLQAGALEIGAAFGMTKEQVHDALLSMYPDLAAFSGSVTDWYTQIKAFDPAVFKNALQGGDSSQLDKATDALKKHAENVTKYAGQLSEASTAMAALKAMQSGWGDQSSTDFIQAKAAAEAYLRQVTGISDLTIKSELDVNKYLVQTQSIYDARLTLWQSEQDAFTSTYGQLSSMRAVMVDYYGATSTQVAALDEVMRTLSYNTQTYMDQVNRARTDSDIYRNQAAAVQDLADAMQTVAEYQNDVNTGTNMVKQFSDWKKIIKAYKDGTGSAEDYQKALKAMGKSAETVPDDALKALDALEQGLGSDVASMEADLAALRSQLVAVQNNSQITGTASMDASNILATISGLEASIAALKAYAAANGVDLRAKGGGGGGKTPFQKDLATLEHDANMAGDSLADLQKQLDDLYALQAKYTKKNGKSRLKLDDQRDLQERIHDMEEDVRSQRLTDALDEVDHKKALNQITLQDEITMLQKIRDTYELTTEELADLDEQLYDAREALRQEQYDDAMADLDHKKAMGELTVQQEIDMLEQIKAAYQLTAEEIQDIDEQLYDLRRQQQEDLLNDQKNAVEKTYDKIVQALKNRYNQERDIELAALDDKIKTLQDKADAEKEAKRVKDYEEALAEKQAKLRTTKSARERREIQKEIDVMIADEAQRQADAARQAEIDALRDEKTAVQDKYAELTNEENLRQEALRLVMSNNLQQMTDLIASYGPKWEDAGALLADYLTQGLTAPDGLITGLQDMLNNFKNSFYENLGGMAGTTAVARSAGVTVSIQGDLVVREEADVDRIAGELLYRIEQKRS